MAERHGSPEKALKPVSSGLSSPLYSAGAKPNLGEQSVGGPRGGMSVPDPLGLASRSKGKKGKK